MQNGCIKYENCISAKETSIHARMIKFFENFFPKTIDNHYGRMYNYARSNDY